VRVPTARARVSRPLRARAYHPPVQQNLESEIAIMKKLKHPHIVRLYDIQTTERHIYLILEYCGMPCECLSSNLYVRVV
jgi:serine/threonine-protein kinase ULK/ATG1